jgi:malate synthase
MGYKFQFITLAGFHALNYSMFELARGYAPNSMRPTSSCRRPSSPPRRTATPRPSTSARSAPATSMAGGAAGAGLTDRRVEITGPTERKMTINALNSGAKVWLADFEDANTPLGQRVDGQLNLRDAIRGTIDFTAPEGKEYELGDGPPPDDRGAAARLAPGRAHLRSTAGRSRRAGRLRAVLLPQRAPSCSTAAAARTSTCRRWSPPRGRLWNDVFVFAQEALGIPRGTIRATVLIETIPAAFEMEEILYELREHSAGLNAGRWDYLFSMIKNFRPDGDFVLPTGPRSR